MAHTGTLQAACTPSKPHNDENSAQNEESVGKANAQAPIRLRKLFSEEFKTKVALAAIRFDNNLAIARYFAVHESNVRLWRKKYGNKGEGECDANEMQLIQTSIDISAKNRQAKFPKMEKLLLKWFGEERAKDHPVSRRMIMLKAKELIKISKECVNDTFKSSCGWFYGFCRRSKISRKKITHVLQRLPDDFNAKIKLFMEDIKQAKSDIAEESGNNTQIIYG